MLLDYCRDCFRTEVSSKECMLHECDKQSTEIFPWEIYLSPRSLLTLSKSDAKEYSRDSGLMNRSMAFDYVALKLSYDSHIYGFHRSPFVSVTLLLKEFVIPKLEKYNEINISDVRIIPLIIIVQSYIC